MKLANAMSLFMVIIVAGVGVTASAQAASLLYAPSETDNMSFRAALSALIGGDVDYFDARYSTPSVAILAQYDAVLTWKDYPYQDAVLMGNRLADYVDVGGKVILGSGCDSGLQGQIMQAAYCPVAVFGHTWEQYAHDGVDCVHLGVSDYDSIPIAALQPGAEADGTLTPSGQPGIAWRADRRVYYGGGNSGDTFGGGDWLHLTANMVLCPPPTGACCDDWDQSCHDGVREADCWGRFASGSECADNPFYPPCGLYTECGHAVELFDSGGDGWTGNTLDVYVDGELELRQIHLASGSGGITYIWLAPHGALITTVFNATGTHPEQAYYTIRDGSGQIIAQDGDGTTQPTGVSVRARCPELPFHGDLNCDGAINAFDIDPFVLALTDVTAYRAAYPDCYFLTADVNGDGEVNAFDIDPFVELLIGPR